MFQPFPVQNSTLSANALAELLHQEYPLPSFPVCKFWRKGMADTYRVSVGGNGYFLKVFMAKRRSRKDVAEEVRLLLHLLHHGVSVCEPIISVKGDFLLSIKAPEGERYAVLYSEAVGVKGISEIHRRAFGRMVARMHQSADSLGPPYGRDCLELEHILDDNLASIDKFMVNRREYFEMISRISSHAKELVSCVLEPRPPEHGVCHGDLFGGDVLFSSDSEPVIFDFESSGTGWRALDIAVFTGNTDWMDTSTKAQLQQQREVGQFLEGYTSVRELTRGEYRVLKLDSAVHHIFLMGLALRYWTIRDGWHWANDDFINWHMKWFRHWCKHHVI